VHERLAVHEISFPAEIGLSDSLSWARAHGIDRIGLVTGRHPHGWSATLRELDLTGVAIAYICHARMFELEDQSTWEPSLESLIESINAAVATGANVVYTTTGPAGQLSFDAAVDALARAVRPAVEHANSVGVRLLTETANQIFAGSHCLHTLVDTIDACEATGLGLCLDVHAVWRERDLQRQIVRAAPLTGLVQLSDFVPGTLSVRRHPIGDGIIPIRDFVAKVLDSGYAGTFDLELFQLPRATAFSDIAVSVERMTAMLTDLGA